MADGISTTSDGRKVTYVGLDKISIEVYCVKV